MTIVRNRPTTNICRLGVIIYKSGSVPCAISAISAEASMVWYATLP